jgi:glycosyltransferase involved in cell wall biosynthesis
VISHPSVLAVNQLVYAELVRRGWRVLVITPDRWRHEYAAAPFVHEVHPDMEGHVLARRVAMAGRPQRHFYLRNPLRELDELRPRAVFCEEEGFSLAAAQWGFAAWRRGIPFGVQIDENLDRPMPAVGRLVRRQVLDRATFVAARSPTAASLVQRWGATGQVELVPHHVPAWPPCERTRSDVFTVGYAGRLVAQKGLDTLVGAVRRLDLPVELLVAGDGPMRSWLEDQDLGGARLRLITGLGHGEMVAAYAQMDVLVLPSRTTSTWAEQFGRVLVEALWCETPVVGSDSGEIPWVVKTTGGGLTFPEDDEEALGAILSRLRASPILRRDLARRGRKAVEGQFSVIAVADRLEQLLVDVGQSPGR